MQALLFKDVGITTEYDKFAPMLNEFGNQERLQKAELARRAKLTQGQAYRVFRDAKLLGLVKNGDGLSILPLGRQWLREAGPDGLPSPATLRQAALNVPLFAQTMRDLGENNDTEAIYIQFCRLVGETTRPKELGSARRRYLEAFVRKRLPAGIPVPASATATPSAARAHRLQLATAYSNLIQTYGEDAVEQCHAFFFASK
jgi:hypothetical protein